MNYKKIHIGELIEKLVKEQEIDSVRICNFMKLTKQEIENIYNKESIECELLLKWSKLLEYDFFRLYSQHLILYAPSPKKQTENQKQSYKSVPDFRKNIYTKETIEYILNKINKGEMQKKDVIERYNIPKTTLYKWLSKYNNHNK